MRNHDANSGIGRFINGRNLTNTVMLRHRPGGGNLKIFNDVFRNHTFKARLHHVTLRRYPRRAHYIRMFGRVNRSLKLVLMRARLFENRGHYRVKQLSRCYFGTSNAGGTIMCSNRLIEIRKILPASNIPSSGYVRRNKSITSRLVGIRCGILT